jgi:ElaB/YqjD/DUF883 family membrane-anchored ribosome-binding protein
MSTTLDAIGDRVSPGRVVQRNKNRVVIGAQGLRDRVMGTAEHAQHKLADTGHRLADTTSSAGDSIKHVPDAVTTRTEGAPMVAGAIAFGIGFLVAAAFPPSQAEKDASAKVMEQAQPLKEGMMEAAHEVADHLKQPAMDAAQQVKQAAGESAQSVSSSAKEAVAHTKDQATESVQAVKSGEASASG